MYISKPKHLVFLCLYLVFASIIALVFSFNALAYLFASWIIPIIFFLYKIKYSRLKFIVSALLWSLPASILIDYVGHISKSWNYWENDLFSSTGVEFIGIPIESFIWGFSFWLYFVLIYEYFLDKHRTRRLMNREKLLLVLVHLVALIIFILIDRGVFSGIGYFYLIVIVFYSVYNLLILYKFPHLTIRVLIMGLIGLSLGMIIEITSLELGLWVFPQEASICFLKIFEHQVPIEEIIWWFVLPISIVLTHEVISDTQD